MPFLRDYHIFISHSWDYSEQYKTIKEWLSSSSYFRWSDYSVPIENRLSASNKSELMQRIADRISICSCIIILSGMYVPYSEWIDFEIDTALSMGKPIIGIKPWGQERIPTIVQDSADTIVGWNSSSVIDAVRCFAR